MMFSVYIDGDDASLSLQISNFDFISFKELKMRRGIRIFTKNVKRQSVGVRNISYVAGRSKLNLGLEITKGYQKNILRHRFKYFFFFDNTIDIFHQ